MAKAELSPFLEALSGKLGNSVVFRKFGDRTIMTKVPDPDLDPSESQKQQRNRFRLAAQYAKVALQDPNSRARYQALADKQQNTLMAMAIRDFFRPPEIYALDTSQFQGQAGEVIRIQTVDDGIIAAVELSVYLPDGSLSEKGLAVQQAGGLDWEYTVTTSLPELSGSRIEVVVYDQPGNSTTQEVVF